MIEIKLYKYICENLGFSQFYPVNSEKAFLEEAKMHKPIGFYDSLFDPFREFNKERNSNLLINDVLVEPKAELDLYYFTYKNKLCDIIDPWVGLHDGMFVSERCLELFRKYLKLPPIKIYPIYYKKKDKIVSDYYYIYFYFGLRNSIVFDKSYFMLVPKFKTGLKITEEYAVEKNVQFKDVQHLNLERDNLNSNTELGIDYQKVVFQKDTISRYDIFPIHLLNDSDLYLSEKFIDMYNNENLTGIDWQDREFCGFFED